MSSLILGWWDIGYHYLIGEDGYAYEGRGWNHEGAQVKSWNKVSLGISVMGNFMNVTPNDGALHTVKGLIDCALQKVTNVYVIAFFVFTCICRRSTYTYM